MPTSTIVKSIVVHLADDPSGPDRVRFAVALAGRLGAHLDGVYTSRRVSLPAPIVGRGMSLGYVEAMSEESRGHVDELLAVTEEICQDLPSWQWHMGTPSVEDSIARYSHLADMVVVEQPSERSREHASLIELGHYAELASGSPLLVIPPHWQNAGLGERVLYFWRNSSEAISAVRSSYSLLQKGVQAFVVADHHDRFATPPGSDFVAYLARHDVRAEIVETHDEHSKNLINIATSLNCDLMVMGAVPHHGLKDMILGTTTDHVLQHARVPVLVRR